MTKKEQKVLDELQKIVKSYYPKLKELMLSSVRAVCTKRETNSLGQTKTECACPFCGGVCEPTDPYRAFSCPHCGNKISGLTYHDMWHRLSKTIALTFDVPSLPGSFGFAFAKPSGNVEYDSKNIAFIPKLNYNVSIIGVMTQERMFKFALNNDGKMVPSKAIFARAHHGWYGGDFLNYSTGNKLGINAVNFSELKNAVDNFVPPAPQTKVRQKAVKKQTLSFSASPRKPEEIASFVFDVYSDDSVSKTAEINAQCITCGEVFNAKCQRENHYTFHITCPKCGAAAFQQYRPSKIITEVQDDGDNYNIIRYICRFDKTWQLTVASQELHEAIVIKKATGNISIFRYNKQNKAWNKVKTQKTLYHDRTDEKVIIPASLKDIRINDLLAKCQQSYDRQNIIASYLSTLTKHPLLKELIKDDVVLKYVAEDCMCPEVHCLNFDGKTKAELFRIPENTVQLADKHNILQISNITSEFSKLSLENLEYLLKMNAQTIWINELIENGIQVDEFIEFAKTATETQAMEFNSLARAFSSYIKLSKELGNDISDPAVRFPEHFREAYARTYYLRNDKCMCC